MDRDLFGNIIASPAPAARPKRKSTRPSGYAWTPGTGPQHETCASCRYLTQRHLAKTYLKCRLVRETWTGGAKTDVQARSPACLKWEPRK